MDKTADENNRRKNAIRPALITPMPKITPIAYKKLVKIFELEGFVFSRQKGDHLIYTKSGVLRPLVIPAYDEVPVFIILNLLRTAKVSREKYIELSSKV